MVFERRIYTLDPNDLSEEQLAVVFAMTSRSPQPFDEIAKVVNSEKAADFHERWVLNYGHASVAEHAILHMAVENISRLACDSLEDNRLASYTEKSSRYQVLEEGSFHIPSELDRHPIRSLYIDTCEGLFAAYHDILRELIEYLKHVQIKSENERETAYNLRLRRVATDACRFLLPAAALTNVGITMNARSMEHAISKLLSSDLSEERDIGESIKGESLNITPTLIKYAYRNEYMVLSRESQKALTNTSMVSDSFRDCKADLVHYDENAESKLVAALLYRFSSDSYEDILAQTESMDTKTRETVFSTVLDKLGPHDVPLRELEMVDYTFDLVMDYGAFREFKRHRMQTYMSQPPTVDLGYIVPELITEAGKDSRFRDAMDLAAEGFHKVGSDIPELSGYLVTHAHLRRALSKMNLRECYHLFKLRTGPQAHFTLRRVACQMMDLVSERHPLLFKYLQLRGD